MEIRNNGVLLANLLVPQNQQKSAGQPPNGEAQTRTQRARQDIVSIGEKANNVPRTRLIDETITRNDNGFRRTQEFENQNGRTFTRIEDVTTTPNRTRRVVIQQQESGSTTALEEIFDRQQDGTFRLTSRFTDETGRTETNIELNVTPPDRNIILGNVPNPDQNNEEPFNILRGTQFDVSA